jgi:hypothetical protein
MSAFDVFQHLATVNNYLSDPVADVNLRRIKSGYKVTLER